MAVEFDPVLLLVPQVIWLSASCPSLRIPFGQNEGTLLPRVGLEGLEGLEAIENSVFSSTQTSSVQNPEISFHEILVECGIPLLDDDIIPNIRRIV